MTGEIPVLEVDILNGERGCYVLPKWALEDLIARARERDEDAAE